MTESEICAVIQILDRGIDLLETETEISEVLEYAVELLFTVVSDRERVENPHLSQKPSREGLNV